VETIVLQVSGMSCAGCEQRIGAVLRRVEGVREVAADHASGRVEVRIGAELTDPGVLSERIEAAGYQVVQDDKR
jgi:copper chaperone CopZ